MRSIIIFLACVAAALAATTPVLEPLEPVVPIVPEVPEEFNVERCTQRCVAYSVVNPTYVQPCLASCNLHLGKRIEETLMRLTSDTEPTEPTDYKALYRDGVILQNQLFNLRRAVQHQHQTQQQPSFGSFFPNLGFLSTTPGVPTPFQAPAQPQYPGILMQITETITSLLNQVIKRQQEILQMIIGCNCMTSTTAAPATTAAPTTAAPTTAAPVVRADDTLKAPIKLPIKLPEIINGAIDILKPVVPAVDKIPRP
ncbi:uncharacterized protein LOC132200805 [Neocloeon triangulifer]|uniref:uncharacterized protein LOC132200805 n=1 Tax=Neocloeon triangulifer TaxID=2078957 RepID=UPI00286F5719|nr:uncharacterized protein LOC132200805 [Neocloeon triangulifer]XP_059482521.1 uncharacterized protein LOC132200805 [Neocloeon triangulifer]